MQKNAHHSGSSRISSLNRSSMFVDVNRVRCARGKRYTESVSSTCSSNHVTSSRHPGSGPQRATHALSAVRAWVTSSYAHKRFNPSKQVGSVRRLARSRAFRKNCTTHRCQTAVVKTFAIASSRYGYLSRPTRRPGCRVLSAVSGRRSSSVRFRRPRV